MMRVLVLKKCEVVNYKFENNLGYKMIFCFNNNRIYIIYLFIKIKDNIIIFEFWVKKK